MIATGAKSKQKWNKDLIRQLYLAGYDIPEIIKLDQFSALSANYLQKMVYGERWHELRKQLREQAKALGDLQLTDLFKQQGDEHYRFIVDQLEKHRDLIRKRPITGTREGQQKDLSLLSDYDALARKVLGLDKSEGPGDRNQMALRALISIQQNGPQKAPNVASAIDVFPSDQNHSTAILGARNGTSENGQTINIALEMKPESENAPGDETGSVGWSGEIRGKR